MATQAEVGQHLDLSERSVRDLITRAILPQTSRKALDLDACRIAYIRHLRETAAGRATGAEADDLTAERARLAKEQADHYSLKNGQLRGELVSAVEITRAVVSCFGHVRDRLTALPARLAGPLARMATAAETRAALSRGIDEALMELAEVKVIEVAEVRDAA